MTLPGVDSTRFPCTQKSLRFFQLFVSKQRPSWEVNSYRTGIHIMNKSDDDQRLIERARTGDMAAAGDALVRHRGRLRRMVDARLDRRVRGRVDPSAVLQDGFADAIAKLPGYLADPKLPVFLWLR